MLRKNRHILLIILLFIGIESFAQDYSIQKLPFSTSRYDEYSPVYYGDGIVFCTNKRTNLFITYFSDRTNKPLIDLFMVEQQRRNNWGKPQLFDKKFKTHFNDGPATFNDRDKLIFFGRNIRSDKKIGNSIDRRNRLGLFYAESRRKEWKEIQAFEHNSEQHNLAHPSLTQDGNTLYFASDMEGGHGGIDLYVSYFQNGSWSEPINLGTEINTAGNEVFPFIHQSGRLYFSSNGHEGSRRLDIYYSEQVNGKWHKPIALESPINSRSNDFGYIIDGLSKNGLFSSDRDGSDDIYSFITMYPMYENMTKQEDNSYCYGFFEEGTDETDTTVMKYEWDLGDGTKIKGAKADHCYEKVGEYEVLLNVIDPLTGDVWFNQASHLVKVEDIQQAYINCPDTVYAGKEITIDAKQTHLPEISIRQYYWDFGDGRRTRGIEKTHIYSSPGEYIIQLGVKSKKDKDGNEHTQGVYKSIVVLDPKSRGRKRSGN